MAVMKRTTIMLPTDLKVKSQREARRQGVSLGQMIRKSLETELAQAKKPRQRRFFPGFDWTFTDDGPPDLVANLDKYLNEVRERDYQRQTADFVKAKAAKRRRSA